MPAAIFSGTDSLGNFQSAFASRDEPAWHGLGTVFGKDEHVSTADMLAKAHLAGWNVRKVDPVVYASATEVDGETIYTDPIVRDRWSLPGYAIVRDNPFDGLPDVLALVGDRYNVSQNEELFSFGDNLLDGGTWETAGAIKDGRVIFGSLRMKRDVVLDPKGRKDKISNYLLVASSHDGSMPLTALNTPVRVVCQNTLRMALSGAKASFKVRHTGTLAGKVETARNALAINVGYMDRWQTEAQAMIETTLTMDQFTKIVSQIFPEPKGDTKQAATRYSNKIDLLTAIYQGQADGPDTQSKITGTVWGGLNAVTEMQDWYRKPRKGEAEGVLTAAAGLDPVQNAIKDRTIAAFRSLVTV